MGAVHIIFNLLAIVGLFAAGWRLRHAKRQRAAALGGAIALAGGGYLLGGRPDLQTAIFPFSAAIFYSNLYPAAAALAAGPAWSFGRSRFHRIRIAVLVAALFGISLWPFKDFWRAPAETEREWVDENGICRQSAPDTCSAAAVVTLLKLHGIDSTETEVARLALTKRGVGTRTLGQYRAMKLILKGTDSKRRAKVRKLTTDEVLARGEPCVITVGLPKRLRTSEQRELSEKYQWAPGVMHDVVWLGFNADDAGEGSDDGDVGEDRARVRIGEPDFGLELWWTDQLRVLFQGYAIYLEEG